MVGCGISTDALIATPAQELSTSVFGSIFLKLIFLGLFLGLAALAVFLYRRSNKKEKKEEKHNFRPKEKRK
ncbi:hypothetical protein EXS74_02280 [Candidatus Woesearchaeota archaeon]|nr:hypothetical protein [Candidatus Woesearchaeota archaeon]